MITRDNFRNVLLKLGFDESDENVLTKSFGKFELKADFANQALIYPENAGFKINERQTCNFNQNENFVVFECVRRLFEKGYQPKHIELEPKWKLGHGASGGRADIWVKDNDGNSLLIIECKTAGKEFEDAWKDTLEDGGQLFSYFRQERSTQFLALYTSDFINDNVNFEYKLIAVRDNEEYLKSFGKKEAPNFKDADNEKNIYKAWSETYQKDFSTKGLFENDIPAYSIGKQKYSTADLKEVDNESIQKKYYEFATILRQHNVSGHENAFDKLVNLFLAKIVDENNNKDELAFYWKGTAYDDVKSLIDRLQKHYKIGMEKFLNEEVTYIDKEDIDKAFRLFKNKPDATKETILKLFDELKYYTNNDFAFIDVHNEKLFYQNSEVLLKIVRMLQDIKLQTDEQNQFLGDLFEGFLDKGVKQSEGQFFTPMPVVKFLISCLPLEEIISKSEKIPRVIDYACGAGHFLNEYANHILPLIKRNKKKDFYKAITGIEKEYRLSKVAKVSAFMYGQDDINIIYADALAKNRKIREGTFSVLVANPPYSVKGFLETLDDESLARFDLSKNIDDKQKKTNNSIECFFVERAKQLLTAGGVAAIILPSSILSNGNIYTRMREILLKYFDIVAIAEFGSGTFGKTGTNTATLFLKRKDDNPDLAEHFDNCVEQWFKGDLDYTSHYKIPPMEWIDNYCKKLNISANNYKTLLTGKPNKNLLNAEIFKEYKKDFENSAEYKNIQKKKITGKYTKKTQEQETEKAHLNYLQKIEKDKLYYFLLAESQKNPVVLVKSPADSKAMKNFLGYEWSSAKGNEGIKYIGANVDNDEDAIGKNKGINQIKTPLFNPNNLADNSKINTIIRNNFLGTNGQNSQPDFVSFARLSDMLDFSRTAFDKVIKTTPEKKMEIQSNYPIVKIGELCDFKYGKALKENDRKEGVYPVMGSNGRVGFHNEYLVEGPCIIIGRKGSAGVLTWENENCYPIDTTFSVKIKTENINLKYFFEILQIINIEPENKGTGVPGLNRNEAYQKKIPLPPLEIQQKVVSECQKIDEEYNTSRMTMEEYKNKIVMVFETLEVLRGG